jgi:hypothetical protein
MTDQKSQKSISGIVTARNCPACGHHEIGLVSDDGTFHPFKPGNKAVIISDASPEPSTGVPGEISLRIDQNGETADGLDGSFWAPEPLKRCKRMRLKYGVAISENAEPVTPSGQVYESAFLEKLRYLLENEIHIPIAVILDRFFAAPHLASGEIKDIVQNMWEELEEIRRPVERVQQWIEEPNDQHLNMLIQPDTLKTLENDVVSDDEALNELESLELEDFLNLL